MNGQLAARLGLIEMEEGATAAEGDLQIESPSRRGPR